MYYGAGGGEDRGSFQKNFHMLKKTAGNLEARLCQAEVVFPFSKELTVRRRWGVRDPGESTLPASSAYPQAAG